MAAGVMAAVQAELPTSSAAGQRVPCRLSRVPWPCKCMQPHIDHRILLFRVVGGSSLAARQLFSSALLQNWSDGMCCSGDAGLQEAFHGLGPDVQVVWI